MSSFIVMQGETYQEEKKNGILWSPQTDRSGMAQHSYKRLEEVKKGDKIFHYVKGAIVALSVAVEDCKKAKRPYHAESENAEGYLVKAEYRELETPLHVSDCIDDLVSLLPVKYSAFQEDGSGNPGYLYPCNEELTLQLLEGISLLNVYIPDVEQLELAMEVVRTTEHHPLIMLIAETVLETRTKMERREISFHQRVAPLWDHQCAVCGIDQEVLLKASPAKPWKDCTGLERMDPRNGILLCRNHDALYTNGLITVNANGKLQVAAKLAEQEESVYLLPKKLKIVVDPGTKPYFKWHKKHVFIDKRKTVAPLL
ncbi:HNH endonuclease [Planococcus sp. YIM B11945]|uniref:HNH endonuclease n=1 Tax=Planococcus sp. YIM B11945 TaxID=3435410 RepID=UPI003D7C5D61